MLWVVEDGRMRGFQKTAGMRTEMNDNIAERNGTSRHTSKTTTNKTRHAKTINSTHKRWGYYVEYSATHQRPLQPKKSERFIKIL
jgi:hypothetical protein